MFDDLTEEEAVELALEYLLRDVTVPLKLRQFIGEEGMTIIEGLVGDDED